MPVILSHFWIQPSATERAIAAHDPSDPARPGEASRLVLDSAFTGPHRLALDPAMPHGAVFGVARH